MKDKIIILSGGMDSVTLLYDEKDNIKMALSFFYGQKHRKELSYAIHHCLKLGIDHKIHKIVDLQNMIPLLKSNLLETGGDIPDGHYEDESMKQTVVPFRNGIMLAIAAGVAESHNCRSVLIGNHAGDHAIYPDCRLSFIEAMNEAMKYGTYAEIEIEAPFVSMSKRDIAVLGKSIGVPYAETWSCYKGREFHCGKCGTCTERKEALEGFDPTIYEGESKC